MGAEKTQGGEMIRADLIVIVVGALISPIILFLLFLLAVELFSSWLSNIKHTHFEGKK